MGLLRSKVPSSNELNYFGKRRYPPGQYTTEKFPVLTYGVMPNISIMDWRLKVWGAVEEIVTFTWDEFMKLPQKKLKADFHCVTTWSRYDDEWEGVMFSDLLKVLKIKPEAKHVMQHAYGGYTTNLPLQWMLNEDVIFVHTMNGKPLSETMGVR